MELAFKTKEIRRICEKQKEAEALYGASTARLLRARLADICSAQSPFDIPTGSPRFSKDSLVLSIGRFHEIVLAANHVRNPIDDSGAIVWQNVRRVIIVRIGEDGKNAIH